MSGSTIIVNGKVFETSGKNITITNNRVVVDGQVLSDEIKNNIEITINGNVENLTSEGSVKVNGNVSGLIQSGGSVKCKDVRGNINSSGSIKCNDVIGNITSFGSVDQR